MSPEEEILQTKLIKVWGEHGEGLFLQEGGP